GFAYLDFSSVLMCLAGGCGESRGDPKAEAPPAAVVEHEQDANVFQVDHPEQFPLFTAIDHPATTKLIATGVVSPDISRTVPVISLASGRVVELRAQLGDEVKRGQILLRVESSDISSAFSDYRKAVADEIVAREQLGRAKELYEKGAYAQKDLQAAQDTEEKAKVDVETTAERVRVMGGDLGHPTGVVEIRAPVSGVITDQQVANAGGVQGLSSTNPFTISDLSSIWIICDVYENDLGMVHVGDFAEIRLNAYPGKVFRGRIGNIGPILDPNTRTAKVRIEVKTPGVMKIGMFVTATIHGEKKEMHAAVPADAILHLHDRDWVYVPAGEKTFRRVEVTAGETLPNKMEEIVVGVHAGQRVVRNALVLQNTVEQ
ncbi:MAG: efflux RND transporter periplasmic adaptor subunit, partial [Candidatus Acidiferrum sp.]